jgi:glycerol kinase
VTLFTPVTWRVVRTASRTLLMNPRTLDWDDDLLDTLAIPRALLPEIRSSRGVDRVRIAELPGDRGDQATFRNQRLRP